VEAAQYSGDLYECVGPTPAAGGTFACSEHRYKVYGAGRLVAVVKRDAFDNTTERYVHPDRLGSSSLITDKDGLVVEKREFKAFGDTDADFNATGINAGFTGQDHDQELGLVNMKGRLYDPKLSRFISPDPFVSHPLDPQGLNRYSYVQNNPLTLVDPSGFGPEDAGNQDDSGTHSSGGGDTGSHGGAEAAAAASAASASAGAEAAAAHAGAVASSINGAAAAAGASAAAGSAHDSLETSAAGTTYIPHQNWHYEYTTTWYYDQIQPDGWPRNPTECVIEGHKVWSMPQGFDPASGPPSGAGGGGYGGGWSAGNMGSSSPSAGSHGSPAMGTLMGFTRVHYGADISYPEPITNWVDQHIGLFPVLGDIARMCNSNATAADYVIGTLSLAMTFVPLGKIAGAAAGAVAESTSSLARASEAAFRAAARAEEFTVGAKHLAGAGGSWAKFAVGVDANAALRDALNSPYARFFSNDATSFKVIADLGQPIGTAGQTGVRAVVDFNAHVVTWFPVNP
jgi:RHS repeat-associated protein